MAAAVADPDPVLYYEHIALYRDPRIKQRARRRAAGADADRPAALRRAGDDLAIISYGAYVHVALRVAERLAADGIEAQRARPAHARAARSRRAARRRAALPPGADRPRGLADRRHRREPRRDHPGRGVRMRSTRRCGSSARSTRRCRTRRRSRSSICRARIASSAPRACSPRIDRCSTRSRYNSQTCLATPPPVPTSMPLRSFSRFGGAA